MSIGKYKVMRQFADEDKYLGLTKRQLVWALPAVAVILGVCNFFGMILHCIWAAMLLSILIIEATAVMMFYKIPEHMYLIGGGSFAQTILYRILLRKFVRKNKIIYTKVNGED